jgi:hypothetical protein
MRNASCRREAMEMEEKAQQLRGQQSTGKDAD